LYFAVAFNQPQFESELPDSSSTTQATTSSAAEASSGTADLNKASVISMAFF